MTNTDIQKLKKYIKFSNVIDSIPIGISNALEKLSGKKVRGKQREFTESELGYIQYALLAIAHTIIKST